MATTAALYLGSAAQQSLNHKGSMHGKETMVIDFPILISKTRSLITL